MSLGFRNVRCFDVSFLDMDSKVASINQGVRVVPSDGCLVCTVSQASEIHFARADVHITRKVLSPLTFKDATGLSVFS